VVVSASVIVASDGAEREAARTQVAFYASTPSYRPVLEHHGWGAVGDELGALARSGQWEAMPRRIDDAMLDAFAVVAPPDDLPAAIRSRCAGLVHRVSLYRPFVPGADDAGWIALVRALGAP
jgi:hypothetical protein